MTDFILIGRIAGNLLRVEKRNGKYQLYLFVTYDYVKFQTLSISRIMSESFRSKDCLPNEDQQDKVFLVLGSCTQLKDMPRKLLFL